MVYRFSQLSRVEGEAILGITLQETRVYQEAKEEGRQEGRRGGETRLVIRQVTRRFGALSAAVTQLNQSWLGRLRTLLAEL